VDAIQRQAALPSLHQLGVRVRAHVPFCEKFGDVLWMALLREAEHAFMTFSPVFFPCRRRNVEVATHVATVEVATTRKIILESFQYKLAAMDQVVTTGHTPKNGE
jgi:hypothetical protein